MGSKSFENLVNSRKSIRVFKPDPVPRKTLDSQKLFSGLAMGDEGTGNSFSRLQQSRVSKEEFVFYQG